MVVLVRLANLDQRFCDVFTARQSGVGARGSLFVRPCLGSLRFGGSATGQHVTRSTRNREMLDSSDPIRKGFTRNRESLDSLDL